MSKRKAFTLIELLVVVGIIAVLIALLMPAFQRAPEHARRVACIINLRQLAMATFSYTNNNQGKFPATGTEMNDDDWIHWEQSRNVEDGALAPYVASRFDPRHYLCPSDILENHRGSYDYSYSVNWKIFLKQRWPGAQFPITKIPRQTEMILFVDGHADYIPRELAVDPKYYDPGIKIPDPPVGWTKPPSRPPSPKT